MVEVTVVDPVLKSAVELLRDSIPDMSAGDMRMLMGRLTDPGDLALLETIVADFTASGWRSGPLPMAMHLEPDKWEDWPYANLLSRKFVEAANGISTRQLWALPPRYGKSWWLRWGLLWALDHYPDRNYILTSYADTLARESGVWVRDAFKTWRSDLRTGLARAAADRMTTPQGGGLLTTGIDGSASGFPGHGVCFIGSTIVETPTGPRTIDTITRGSEIYGYDHINDRIVTGTVTATSVRETRDLVEVTFESGRRFVCTPEHPIYVEHFGYIPAGLIEHGAQVRGIRDAGLPRLHEDVHTSRIRSREVAETGSDNVFLRSYLPRTGGSARLEMFGLWDQYDLQTNDLRSVFTGAPQGRWNGSRTANDRLSPMQNGISTEVKSSGVLLAAMCGSCAQHPNARPQQFPFSCGQQSQQPFQQDETVDPGTRWERLRGVPRGTGSETACTSHQRKPDRQSAREPGDSVRESPSDSPQSCTDTVSMVRRLRDRSVRVYDLTVEDTHNFFASGILVHNCVDDPFRNWQEAHSPARRRHIFEQYRSVFRRRLEQIDSFMIVATTRWHEEDLIGMLLQAAENDTGEKFEIIRLPEYAEEADLKSSDPSLRLPDPLGRKPGELLEPRRFNAEAVRLGHLSAGSYLSASMLQQRPAPEEGTEVLRAWFKLEEQLPLKPDAVLCVWDMKLKDKESGDYVVGQVWWRVAGGYWLMDQLRGQWNEATTKAAFALMAVRRTECKKFVYENTGNAPELVAEMRRPMPSYVLSDHIAGQLGISDDGEREAVQNLLRRGLSGLIPKTPKGDKSVRMRAVSPLIEAGDVHLPANASWVPHFLDEMAAFGSGSGHDDQVDCVSMGLALLAQVRKTKTFGSELQNTRAGNSMLDR